jgi:hypothetical protein
MVPIDFQKSAASYFLDCIREGQPIRPSSDSEWKVPDLITLAGACQTAIHSGGPPEYRVRFAFDQAAIAAALYGLHPEHREFVERQFAADLLAAIGLSSDLTAMIDGNGFDRYFERRVQAIVGQPIVDRKIIRLAGFRSQETQPASDIVE